MEPGEPRVTDISDIPELDTKAEVVNKVQLPAEANPPKAKTITKTILSIVKTPRNYTNLTHAMTLFGKKYYQCPLKLINDEIRLLDKNMKEILYDFKLVVIDNYDMSFKTFFNENNNKILTDEMNDFVTSVHPKYKHFINFSKSPTIYICCDEKAEPVYLNSMEINVSKTPMAGDLALPTELIF